MHAMTENSQTAELPVVHGGCKDCKCRKRDKLTILLVDDDPDFLETLSGALKRTGQCEVLTAPSAEGALALMAKSPVDLVLADHHMEGLTGTDLLEHLRTAYPEVKRAITSGSTKTAIMLAGAINRGAVCQWLPKGMAPHLMVKRLLTLLVSN